LRDLPQALAILAAAAAMSVAGVYLTAAFARFAARLLGGVSTGAQVRAALAWGAVPLAWGVAISVPLFLLRAQMGREALQDAAAALLWVAIIWSFIVTVAMLMEVEKLSAPRALAAYAGAVLFLALAVGVPFRAFLWQPFSTPSDAGAPTLIAGDQFFASKYAYGYSRHSFPYSPALFAGRIFFTGPERGDLVVFKSPADGSTDYVKRVVGLPGDRIELTAGVLSINGVPVKRERVEDRLERTSCGVQPVHVYRETLPGGRSYLTQKVSETCERYALGIKDSMEAFEMPAGHYFMLGDNRDNSADSRYPVGQGVGLVPEDNLIGRAEIIFLSVSKEGDSRAGRLLKSLR
jgi:signal peptidase I